MEQIKNDAPASVSVLCFVILSPLTAKFRCTLDGTGQETADFAPSPLRQPPTWEGLRGWMGKRRSGQGSRCSLLRHSELN